ncbi:hypothetical protein [uncultured Propionibacterium sp.]|uniref:hypothetical protein n=1 Tax=uncultured Propionibacterium sp. TaxID=218066 RepID=UPI00292E2ADC|nr:hypothetical protein [uncultured Propionibacterium sp.]
MNSPKGLHATHPKTAPRAQPAIAHTKTIIKISVAILFVDTPRQLPLRDFSTTHADHHSDYHRNTSYSRHRSEPYLDSANT